LRNRPSFQTWALVEHFIELSWDSRYDNLAAMRELAEASVLVADSIPETRYGREAIHDLRGRARAYLANAWRANLDLRTAGRIFKEAEDELRQGTGDRLELGTLLYLKLNLFRRQGLWEEAHRACSRCQAIFERLDQPRMLARALAARAELFLFQDEFEPAIELCKRSLELLGGHDERFELSIRHNLALGLFHHGRKEEALARLQEARPLYFKVGDRLNQLRLRYFEGDIAASLNQYSLAEACLTEARDGMVANDVPWEAAEISLRLAEVYLVQGRMEACRELAEQLTPIFQARDFHTEAVAAMLLVREAMLAETVTAVMLQETVEFLRRLRQGS
jgi:tetratricopeptide (TPR) repeat protein